MDTQPTLNSIRPSNSPLRLLRRRAVIPLIGLLLIIPLGYFVGSFFWRTPHTDWSRISVSFEGYTNGVGGQLAIFRVLREFSGDFSLANLR
jgi:hypothetical protein